MALNLFARYPGRSSPASIDYPQGSFKNKTAPTATDGTLLEQDWANDSQGFLQSLLSYFGVTANGQVDKVGASQYFDALTSDPTEVRKGMSHVATQAEVNNGTNDTKIVTPKKLYGGLLFSFVSDGGFIKFPSWLGGLIFQWGSRTITPGSNSNSTTAALFPVVFPVACLSVNTTLSNSPVLGAVNVSSESFTRSGYSIVSAGFYSSPLPILVRFWAVGF